MHRLSVRRVLGAVCVVLASSGSVVWLVAPPGPAFAGDATDPSTIAFLGGGPAPLACSSTPSPPSLTVASGIRVVLANFTGVDATIDVGAKSPVAVADGAAISVKFKEGRYSLRMVPNCLQTFDVQAATVIVAKAGYLPDPTPTGLGYPAGPTASASPAPSLAAGSAAGSSGSNGQSGSALSPRGSGPSEVGDDPQLAGGPDVRGAVARRPVDTRPDGRGPRLLAVIAAICVFGVTTAIIRAIVSQRMTGASVA